MQLAANKKVFRIDNQFFAAGLFIKKIKLYFKIEFNLKFFEMKGIIIVIALMIMPMLQAQVSFYDLNAKTIDGKDFSFESLKGKKVLVVNVASKCGFTPQYEELELMYQLYGGNDFTIIGFPANDFMKQEPGTDEEIMSFCTANYGVTFQMMSKISVKGDDIHPVYQWLTDKKQNGVKDSSVKWNFQKYLIDEKGHLVEVFSSKTKPLSEDIVQFLKK